MPDPKRIADLPPGLEVAGGPPQGLQDVLAHKERPCGEGRFGWIWAQGPTRGEPISVWCAEPLCLSPLAMGCTGPAMVPHPQQYDASGAPRKLEEGEPVVAARMGAAMAAERTGRNDNRSDREIAEHIARTWQRMRAAAEGGKFG